jgi:hypothetical protein
MVNLTALETYWNSIITRVPTIKKAFFVTEEGDMKDFIADIRQQEQPFLLVVIPSAKSVGTADAVLENNMNLIYVLSKEDSFNKNTFELQKELQPVMEAIKAQMIEDIEGCGLMRRLDISSMQTDPEKRLMSKATGWSLSFEFLDS